MLESYYCRYQKLYLQLKDIIKHSENRVIQDDADKLFNDNVNFFVKSYLISICTYLEAYLQDIAFDHASFINNRVKQVNIPHNFVYWSIFKNEVKAKDLDYKNIDFPITKKDIADIISANPEKTIRLFKYLGINLDAQSDFRNNKDIIFTVVNKRNSIIHHNDSATDISFSDLNSFIDTILIYIKSIDDVVSSNQVL